MIAPQRRRRVLSATIAAQSIEYYDFLIYGTAASLVFNEHFFPSVSAVAGVLASFATFAVGFAGRPVGAVVFGHFGDKFGRKPALLAAMLLMAVSSTLIGLLPTYASIGVGAPLLLVILRLAQGISVGGHFGGATLLALEGAPANRRALFGSIPQLGVVVGMISGTLVFLGIGHLTTSAQFAVWGWRIPFLLSVVMLPVAYYLHRCVEDSPEFRKAEEDLSARRRDAAKSSVVQVLRNPKQVLLAALVFIPATVGFYAIATGLLDHATRDLQIARNTMLVVVMVSMIGFAAGTVGFAWLSDVVGRRRIYAVGAVALGCWAFVLFPLVETRSFPLILLAAVVGQIAVGAMFGPGTALLAEAFPPRVRYSGSSIGNQLANILGGGLAPFVMVALVASTRTTVSVSIYIAAFSIISLVALASIKLPKEMSGDLS